MSSTRREDRFPVARLVGLVCWLTAWSLIVAQTCPPPIGTYERVGATGHAERLRRAMSA